jgi:transposase
LLTEHDGVQLKLHSLTIEDLVPEEHFLRKLEAAVDFSFIYDEVRSLYSTNNGRPSTDPVVLVKYLLVGYLYGIESERRIEQEIQVNMAYRWFLGLDVDGPVPDHSTISQNRRRRFNGEDLFRRLFEHVLFLCVERGLVDGRIILTDSTHVKANASRGSEVRVLVEREAYAYLERLDAYEALERERLLEEKKPSQNCGGDNAPKPVEKCVSTTDPEAGFLRRAGKPQGMHYLSHQSVDAANGIVVDVAVTPGNVNDATPYLGRVEYMRDGLGLPIETVGVDSGYDISLVHQVLSERGIEVCAPANKKNGIAYKVEFDKNAFQYDDAADEFVCPAGKRLRYRRLERTPSNICWRYEAECEDCKACQLRGKCVSPKHQKRCLRVNIFEKAMAENHAKDGTPQHEHILKLRQIWCEGSFAAQKARHNLRCLFRRGKEAAETHCLLSATALNLKRMVKCLG